MPADQEIKISYLVEAVDNASKIVEEVDGTVAKYQESIDKAKAAQVLFNETQVKTAVTAGEVNASVRQQTTAMETLGNVVLKTGIAVGVFASQLFLISSSATAVSKIQKGFIALSIDLDILKGKTGAFLREFPLLQAVATKSFEGVRKALNLTRGGFDGFIDRASKVSFTLNKVGRNATNLGKTFLQSLAATELNSKSLFGMATRAAAAGSILTILGSQLVKTDSLFLKFAGGGIIAASVALFGYSQLIQSIIVASGDLIQRIGTGLVNSLSSAVDQFLKAEKAAFAFDFVIRNLSRATDGATGTLGEWNLVIDDFISKTAFSRDAVQNSVSELVRFGRSIGLTKDEMITLLPIIGDVAAANHRDLFSSTLAVVEGLAGQTVMLQNLGISLNEHALKEAAFAKGQAGSIRKLSEHEKVQRRFNLLLEEAALIQNIATAELQTTAGAIKKQEQVVKDMNAELGKGANLIEQRFNVGLATLVDIMSQFSAPALNAVGFIGALSGRALQAIGVFLKWSFTIVLVSTSIKALNILLRENLIQNFIANIAKASFITETLAKKNALLAATLSSSLTKISQVGLTISSVFTLVGQSIRFLLIEAVKVAAPFALIAAKVLIVVGLFATLYQALLRIEEVTGFFSAAWAKLVSIFGGSGIVGIVSQAFEDFGGFLQRSFIKVTFATSRAIVNTSRAFVELKFRVTEAVFTIRSFIQNGLDRLSSAYERAQIIAKAFFKIIADTPQFRLLITIFNLVENAIDDAITKVREFGIKAREAFVNFVNDAVRFLGRLPSKFLELIGFQSAFAGEFSTLGGVIDSTTEKTKGLNEEQLKGLEILNQERKAIDNVIDELNRKEKAELAALNISEAASRASVKRHKETVDQIQKQLKLLKGVQASSFQLAIEQTATGAIKSAVEQARRKLVDMVKEIEKLRKEGQQKEVDNIIKQAEALKNRIGTLEVSAKFSGIVGLIGALKSGSQTFLKAAANFIVKAPDAIANALGPIFKGLGGLFEGTVIPDFLSNIGGAVAEVFGAVAGIFGDSLGQLVNQIIEVFSQDPEEFSAMIVAAIEGLPMAIANIFINLINFPRLIAEGLEKMIIALPEAIEPLIEAMTIAFLDVNFWLRVSIRIVAAFIKNIPEIIQAFIDGFRNGVKEVTKSFSNGIKKTGVELKQAWESVGKTFDAVGKGFKDLVEFIKKAVNVVGKVLGDVGEKILNVGKKFFNFIADAGKKFFNGIKDAGKEIINAIKEGLKDAFKAIGGGLGDAGGFISDIPVIGDIAGAIGGLFEQGGIPALRAQNGLIVPGNSTSGDRVPVAVNSREMILTLDQQARLFEMLQGDIEGRRQQQVVEITTNVQLEEKTLAKAMEKVAVNGWTR